MGAGWGVGGAECRGGRALLALSKAAMCVARCARSGIAPPPWAAWSGRAHAAGKEAQLGAVSARVAQGAPPPAGVAIGAAGSGARL